MRAPRTPRIPRDLRAPRAPRIPRILCALRAPRAPRTLRSPRDLRAPRSQRKLRARRTARPAHSDARAQADADTDTDAGTIADADADADAALHGGSSTGEARGCHGPGGEAPGQGTSCLHSSLEWQGVRRAWLAGGGDHANWRQQHWRG